jgi:hypothetical protein
MWLLIITEAALQCRRWATQARRTYVMRPHGDVEKMTVEAPWFDRL